MALYMKKMMAIKKRSIYRPQLLESPGEFMNKIIFTVAIISQLTPAQCFLFNSQKRSSNQSVLDTCCRFEKADDFCHAFATLSAMDQHSLRVMLGCETDLVMEKRKPNFIRYGRSAPPAFGNSRRLADPNFLRFGRSSPLDSNNIIIPEKKSTNGVSANFLRFGKAASDPNFLRFGKRAPSSTIFGAASESSAPNFLRFGRSGPMSLIGSDDLMQERFSREYRKPNFLRFG